MCYYVVMENIHEVVKNNLVELRKKRGLTQLELAEKINYSNKAVSRWENGEVTPDLETLNKLAKIYDVPLASIIQKNGIRKDAKANQISNANKIVIALLGVVLVWFIAIITYVSIKLIYNIDYWQIFVWAVPLSFVVTVVFSLMWWKKPMSVAVISGLVWTLLTAIYVQLLPYNLFFIYSIGIPVQVALILWLFIKKKTCL